MTLGNKIFNERKKKGYSQEELASKIGVSRQTIYKWENDQAMPDLVNLKKLAEVFETSIEQLLEEKKSEPENPQADRFDQAFDTGARVIKKHWRKSGYVIMLYGLGFTVTGIIGTIMFRSFMHASNEIMYGSSFGGLFGLTHHQQNPFSFFTNIPLIFIGLGLIVIVVGAVLAIKDYRLNHKK